MVKRLETWYCFKFNEISIVSYDRSLDVFYIKNNTNKVEMMINAFDFKMEFGEFMFGQGVYERHPKFFKEGGD